MDDSAKSILVEIRDRIGLISLNNPDRLNAWSREMERQYFDALTELSQDRSIYAIVVTGAGRGFCSGADMDDLKIHAETGETTDRLRPVTFPLTIGKPMIAAVNGPCAGMGLVQALMCDVRFASSDAYFTASFSRIGLIAEHGISWLLSKHVGIGPALDILMSSRRVSAEEALQLRLVSQVSSDRPVLDDALAHADDLARRISPRSMATIKAQVYQHFSVSLAQALDESNELLRASKTTPDFPEGVTSFREHRDPDYEGLSLNPRAAVAR